MRVSTWTLRVGSSRYFAESSFFLGGGGGGALILIKIEKKEVGGISLEVGGSQSPFHDHFDKY